LQTSLTISPSLYAYFSALSFAWGACVGSFLNVCIHRIPRDLSVVRPSSRCPHCEKPIKWYNNIPIFSFLLLRAKCADCGGKITPRYAIVETLVAALFLLVWMKLDVLEKAMPLGLAAIRDPWLVPVYWLVLSGLVLGTFVDIEHLIIPDRVTLGGIVAGLILSIAVPSLHGETSVWRSLMASAVGLAAGWGSLWLISMAGKVAFRKEAMGFGDVKLLGAIGAFLGWRAVVFTILVSSLAGSFTGITLVAAGRREMQSRIPYGPFLALAAMVWVLWGPGLWQMYLDLTRIGLP